MEPLKHHWHSRWQPTYFNLCSRRNKAPCCTVHLTTGLRNPDLLQRSVASLQHYQAAQASGSAAWRHFDPTIPTSCKRLSIKYSLYELTLASYVLNEIILAENDHPFRWSHFIGWKLLLRFISSHNENI